MTLSRDAVLDATRYADGWLAFRQRADRVPGVQAAVLHGHDVVLSCAHGHADVAADVALTTSHLFRIASHSKTFTATAVMQLVQDGAVRLDDPLSTWLPDVVGDDLADVTVGQLLSHGGGVVRDGWDGDHWQLWREFPDGDALRDVVRDRAAVTPPETRFKYSNVGFGLLGLVVEQAAAQPYAEYVSEHVVARLGLLDTAPELLPERLADYATGYTGSDLGERVPIEHVDTAALASATGFTSTASDLVRYAAGHFLGDTRLMDDATRRRMQRTQWAVDGGTTSYAFGLAVEEVGERRLLGHGGGYPGHITRTLFDPVDRLAVSVLTNAIDGPAAVLVTSLVKLVDLAQASSADPRPSGELERYEGRFANLWGVLDVASLGGRLHLLHPTADPVVGAVELEVVEDDVLRISPGQGYGSAGELLVLDRAPDGSVRSVRGGSGSTSYPEPAFRTALAGRERVTVGDPVRPPEDPSPAG